MAKVLARRDFLRLSVLAGGAVAVTACASSPPPPTAKPAAEPTKPPAAPAATQPPATSAPAPTKAAEPTKPAAAATSAPPAAAPATAPPAATKAPAVTATPDAKIGKSLIGKFEGPEMVTDPAQYPKTFKEAPMLAELVKAGKLPPVAERIGQDPAVIKPLREIGKYGGTWRRGFTGTGDRVNGVRAGAGLDRVQFFHWSGNSQAPCVAKGYEVSKDGLTTTLFLRRGMRWSDGEPFTADNFVFAYENIHQNKDLIPIPLPAWMTVSFKPVVLEKVDTYTVVYRAPEPYYVLPELLARGLGNGSFRFGREFSAAYAAGHYLKQFLPKFVAMDELNKKAKEAGFDNWKNLFGSKVDAFLNPEVPVLGPWKTVNPTNTPNWVLERNPYSVWVDTEGNQLPYIDKISMTLGENLEVINLRAIAGEYDKQTRHIDLSKLPVFLENQQKGGYKVYLDPSVQGTDMALFINQSLEQDPELGKWLSTPDFRRALSIGFDREQLNETFWLGLGVPGSALPGQETLYHPGAEYEKLWATYDPKKANEMLDKIGLDKKDGEGYRLRQDGKGRLRFEVLTFTGFLQFTQACEMIREQWKKIGIQADVKEVERTLGQRKVDANEHHLYVDTQWGAEKLFGGNPEYTFPSNATSFIGPLYGRWYASGGQQGKEPPPRMRQVMEMYRKAMGRPAEEQVQIGKEVWKIVADEVWAIGTIGVSPASQGVRVAKTYMMNLPGRQWNSSVSDNPLISHPETFFFNK